ncbi:MAG: short-chain fatty acid transporter [Bacteroidia bacterium]|nr:short-chain fatty acid transporter [Bacteroidia bacterium]
MNIVNGYMKWVKRVLPSPLSIAVLLTLFTGLLAFLFTDPDPNQNAIWRIAESWNLGIWELLTFTMQMMLMLVLGHAIALSRPIGKLIKNLASVCRTNGHAAVFVTFFAVVAGYFNWGLGLIFGAILARKVGEYAREKGIELNYPLIAACGYTSLMVWHGGFSGSAPLTVSSANHSLTTQIGQIPISDTILSTSNIVAMAATLVLLPAFAFLLSRRSFKKSYPSKTFQRKRDEEVLTGAEKLDNSRILGSSFGIVFLVIWFVQLVRADSGLGFINLNSINFLLFGLAITAHGSLKRFAQAAEDAITGSTGILIQFPLYAGIMGIMKYTGLLEVFANFFIDISTENSFPFFAYLSSAVVNVLVPSGGGQWQVQGPILVEAAQSMHIPMAKTVMALAYGDQLTNMLQPFWALPLLGITGLKARDILPYSILFMLLGGCIYLSILYAF